MLGGFWFRLKAFYDPAQDRIVGCEEGTLIYRHEQGHQIAWKRGIDPRLQSLSWLIITVCFAYVGWLSKNIFFGILMGFPLLSLIFSELYAWYYALFGYKQELKT